MFLEQINKSYWFYYFFHVLLVDRSYAQSHFDYLLLLVYNTLYTFLAAAARVADYYSQLVRLTMSNLAQTLFSQSLTIMRDGAR